MESAGNPWKECGCLLRARQSGRTAWANGVSTSLSWDFLTSSPGELKQVMEVR